MQVLNSRDACDDSKKDFKTFDVSKTKILPCKYLRTLIHVFKLSIKGSTEASGNE